MKTLKRSVLSIACTAACVASPVLAAEPDSCGEVSFADVSWTDITATTALVSTVLEGLGYESHTETLSVPGTFNALKDGDVDVFLGNWMPSMEGDLAPFRDEGAVDVVGVNLEGAKYTLAVDRATYDDGLKSFADLGDYADQLENEIYGIEAGNDGNKIIQDMIDQEVFGLEDFELVESSERGMLAEVARRTEDEESVVFLGWEPHPMNANFDIAYLEGGDDFFGPNLGGASVYTNVRAGYVDECSNVGRLLTNLQFTLAMENEVMGAILDDGVEPKQAASAWLKAAPQVLESWLQGVSTIDGAEALPAVRTHLGL